MRITLGTVVLLAAWLGWAALGLPVSAQELRVTPQDLFRRGREVYEVQCAICHGPDGAGNGMAAHMFRIQPRDFRRGLFKFRSTPSGSLPTDEDLLQTVTQGLRWTGMVGRTDLPEDDRKAVVMYLKTFSARFSAERPATPVAVPPPAARSQDLVAKGGQLYRDAECGKCHGDTGRGDGPSTPGMKDDWGWPTRPSDLSWRPLKRGSALEATYLTIATGLSGTPMPSYGDSLDGQEIWALVYFLESLVPNEQRLSPMRVLGEEQAGWMAVRMHGMMGPGMMGPGMMRRRP
ncbi:MAG: c-type cytochrome [Candidatus Methylomirabilota bacterium]